MDAQITTIDTPIGEMLAVADAQGRLIELKFPRRRDERWSKQRDRAESSAHGVLTETKLQLDEYFAGRRRVFDLPIHPKGSDFERAVWEKLREIPYGTTTTYGAIAAAVGMPQAAQAVGKANGANPIPIVIPCHRVIGTDGRLVGFGGGLDVKVALLELEGALPPSLF